MPKADIKGLKVLNSGRQTSLMLPIPDARNFDPYRILGIETTATFDAIRDAYHRLSKLYHPDRYAGIELPPEVAAYLDGKAKSINAAFRALKSAGQKSAAVYTKAPSA